MTFPQFQANTQHRYTVCVVITAQEVNFVKCKIFSGVVNASYSCVSMNQCIKAELFPHYFVVCFVWQQTGVWTVRGTEELKTKLEPVIKSSVIACLNVSMWKKDCVGGRFQATAITSPSTSPNGVSNTFARARKKGFTTSLITNSQLPQIRCQCQSRKCHCATCAPGP